MKKLCLFFLIMFVFFALGCGKNELQLEDNNDEVYNYFTEFNGEYKTIAAGWNHSLAIKEDGSLYVWGNNFSGAVGVGTATSTRVPLKIMDDIISIAAGGSFSLAVKADGSLWAWGDNSFGQIGDGTVTTHVWDEIFSGWTMGDDNNKSRPVNIMDHVVTVAAGYGHSLAIKKDGSLWAWGWNRSGQIGDGTTIDKITPVKIMDNVISVAAGESHSLALKADGSLWAWGDNLYGQLGDGTVTIDSWTDGERKLTEDNNKSTPIEIMNSVSSIASGGWHSLAIKTDGSLWVWGSNSRGEIGDGTVSSFDDDWNRINNDKSKPVEIMQEVIYVAAGRSHSLAITADNNLLTWGDNEFGQLGDGTSSIHDYYWQEVETNDKSTPIIVIDDANVVSVAGGQHHSLALKSDGSLWAWGNNYSGQLGDGSYTFHLRGFSVYDDKSTPVKIMNDVKLPSSILLR